MNGMNFILEIKDNSDEDSVNDGIFSELVKLEPRVSLPSTFIQNTIAHFNNNSNETNYIIRYENNIIKSEFEPSAYTNLHGSIITILVRFY